MGVWQFDITRFAVILAAATALFAGSSTIGADLGAEVSNRASVSFGPPSARTTIDTAPAIFRIEAASTPSTVEFFRYAPGAPNRRAVALNGSEFNRAGAGAPADFQRLGAPVLPGGLRIDVAAPAPLIPTEDYFSGDVVFVRVADAGQNGDPDRIETVTAVVRSGAGDEIILRLFETGSDTGEFFAYFPTTREPTPLNDGRLTTLRATMLTATYQDPFDEEEISTDEAGVDPAGRLFDSVTGAFIDGARVTIVNAATGQPAEVFGIDGVSLYPSTVVTGDSAVDASGFVYDLQPGEFVFPIMFPGEYRLVIEPPGAYSVPSAATPNQLAGLPGGPFEIIDASFLASFTLDGTADVTFDVPLDPRSTLVVQKSASTPTGAIGDFIRYEIIIENSGDNAALLRVRDLLPRGFRFQRGSARRDGAALEDPEISARGETLDFAGGPLIAGETARLSYVAEIASGAREGEAVNRAFVADGRGEPLSNTGQASVFVREDFLRDTLTILGRVAVDACGAGESRSGGEGLAGVRLYLETGAYVATDEDGLFNFTDIEPRAHVVQLDTASLPTGYEPVLCANNTRRAGSAISQFVDAQGGAVWRANFYVRKTEQARDPEAIASTENPPAKPGETYKAYDKSWLNLQDPTADWAYPADGETPSTRALNLGVKHSADTRIELFLNGASAPSTNFAGRDINLAGTVALTRWRGVDLVDGENEFTAVVKDQHGDEQRRLTRRIHFVSAAERALLVAERSTLIADGATSPTIAVRITDGAGRPVHAGRILSIRIDPPYRAKDLRRIEDQLPITTANSEETPLTVGADGIAFVELEPTLQTGRARIVLRLDDERREEIDVFLKPALRDWIVVGLAEGAASFDREDRGDGAPSARDLMGEGRIAVFAKGAVKGDWLITGAVDTAKGRGDEDDELFNAIDPDDRFAVLGDRSRQDFEAQSRYPVYLKAEKGGFKAEFGDYDTGLDESRLGRYARRLSGANASYESQRFTFAGFAAETNQGFARDEIAADGTSGPFTLTAAPLVRNSETLTIETRDRFRPDRIVNATPLQRFIDYDIDFETGEIILRLPVPAASDEASFNVIVAEYETSAPVERDIVAGGRGAVRFAGGRIEAGLTGVHETGRPDASGAASSLAAVDLRADITDTTRLRLEYGASRRDSEAGRVDADAILAEIEHVSEDLTARAYYDDREAGFGLGQQSSGVAGVRRYGGEARLRFDEFYSEANGARRDRFVETGAYREENLETGASRSVIEVALRQESDATSAAVGFRRVVEEGASGLKRKAVLATSEVRHRFRELGLTLRGSRDQPIGGEDGSTLFPKRTVVGFEQELFQTVRLDVSHEIQEGENVRSANTIVGVAATPWAGARLSASGDRLTQEAGERLGATFGADQQVQITENWSGSFGVSRREELGGSGAVSQVDDIVPDDPVSPLENNQDFTSVFVGAGYRSVVSQGSARFEMKKSDLGDRYTGVLGAARELSEAASFAGALRIQQNDNNEAPDERRIDARFGLAWRPRGDGLILLDRFDVRQNLTDGEFTSWTAVNNLALNALVAERWQMSVNHGLKYSILNADNAAYESVTQLVGLESRFDLTKAIDIGVRGAALYSHNARTVDYSFGPSLGVSPAENIWLSLGWNLEGFVDEDFSAADYTREGPFVRLRVKFDQTTAGGLLSALSAGERSPVH